MMLILSWRERRGNTLSYSDKSSGSSPCVMTRISQAQYIHTISPWLCKKRDYWPWNLFKMNIGIGITSYDCTQFLKIQLRWKENLPSNLWFIEGSFGFVCFNILSDSIAVSVSDSYGIRKNKKATYIHDKIYNKTRKMPFMEIFLFAMGCFRLVRLYFSTNTIN